MQSILEQVFRIHATSIERFDCEWAPEPAAHLNDRTAFDAVVIYETGTGQRAFLGFETKYTEPFSAKPYDSPIYREVSDHSGLFKEGAASVLVAPPTNQLWRMCMLGAKMLQNGFDLGRLAVCAPSDDVRARAAVERTKSLLVEDEMLTFVALEDLVEAGQKESDLAEWASQFSQRYLNLRPVNRLNHPRGGESTHRTRQVQRKDRPVVGTIDLRIFLSYRRADARGYAGWLHYCLAPEFGTNNLFRDLSALGAGTRFMEEIDNAIRQADVVLCLMGPEWTAISQDGERRLDKPDDPVRLEVGAALKQRRQVIPILLDGAKMPRTADLPEDIRALTDFTAHSMSDDSWEHDLQQLLIRLKDLAAQKGAQKLSGEEIHDRSKSGKHPPAWVGRTGGLNGKVLRQDIESGDWKTVRYEVQFGGLRPSRNWFTTGDFVGLVDRQELSRTDP